MENSSERMLIFCGDIHGNLRELVWEVCNRRRIECADIIVLGDFGLGFDKSIKVTYDRIKNKLEKSDIVIYSIRGNHDDPSLFENDPYDFPRLKFWKDHTIYELDGRRIYTIGGAHSTDIVWRKEMMEKKPKQTLWWPGEGVIHKPIEELPGRVDIIISHEAPISFDPTPTRFPETPAEQYNEILSDRHYLEDVREKMSADYWFYGHYHNSYLGSFGPLLYRCLGIMELCEAPHHKHTNPQEND